MYQFQRIRVLLIEIDTGNAGVVHLFEEFLQISPSFVIYPCIREKTTGIPAFEDTDTKINILSKTHLGKSSQNFVHFAMYSHIEATGVKFIHLLLSATDTARCEERGHGVVYRFLNIGKGIVCTVGAAESIGRRSEKFFLYRIEVSFGKNNIRI